MQMPTLIEGMTFADYLADPADSPSLTSSIARALLEHAPLRVWYDTPRLNPDAERENKAAFDLGTAVHAVLTGEGDEIAVIDADDYRTKDAKAARDAAYAAGQTPILKGNMASVEAMAGAARHQLGANADTAAVMDSPDTAREASVFWREGGVSCRCRPDFYDRATNTIVHFKTTGTSVSMHGLARYAASSGWDITAAHYAAGMRALTGSEPRQLFAVQETAKPHLLMVAELDPAFYENAQMRRDRALTVWGRCLASGQWPGFPVHTITIELPEWHERNSIAAKDAEQEIAQSGKDILDLCYRWQSPEGMA